MIVVRLLGVLLLAVVAFTAATAGLLYATGNLNQQTFDILLGRAQPAQPEEKQPDDVDQITRALRDREDALNAREKQIEERERQLEIRESGYDKKLAEMQTTLEDLRLLTQQINEAEAAERETRLTDIANSLAKIKPQNASTALAEFDVDTAVEVLRRVEEKTRGKILNELEPKLAAQLLQAMQHQ